MNELQNKVKTFFKDLAKISAIALISIMLFFIIKAEAGLLNVYQEGVGIFYVWNTFLYINMGLILLYCLADIKKRKINFLLCFSFGIICFFIENQIMIETYSQSFSVDLVINRIVHTVLFGLLKLAILFAYFYIYYTIVSEKLKKVFSILVLCIIFLWAIISLYFYGFSIVNICLKLLTIASFYFALLVVKQIYESKYKKIIIDFFEAKFKKNKTE